jgi:hypothetical protein
MLYNHDITTYRNGDVIPEVTDNAQWNTLTTGAWCYYNNDSANNADYGKLYNWYAVNDPRGLAPAGWHVPSKDEWSNMVSALGGDSKAGGNLNPLLCGNCQIPVQLMKPGLTESRWVTAQNMAISDF